MEIKMSASLSKVLITGSFFLVIFFLGFLLSRSGKPYPGLLFNLHKLVALGALVYVAVMVYNAHRAAPFTPVASILALFTGLCFVATIITGGLQNIDRSPSFLAIIHRFSPYLALLGTSAILYFLLSRGD